MMLITVALSPGRPATGRRKESDTLTPKTPRITSEFRVLLCEHPPTAMPGSPQETPLSEESITRLKAAATSMAAKWGANFELEFTGRADNAFKFSLARGLLEHAKTMDLNGQLSTVGNKINQLLSAVNSRPDARVVVRMRAMSSEPKPGPGGKGSAVKDNWQLL
jgi:hypothetical protein